MQVRHREVFTSIQTEGAILPPDLLKRIFSGDSDLDGLKSKDYHLSEGEKLNEAINRSWNVLQGYWRSFLTGKEKLAEGNLGTTLTRERWLLPLFQELGYGRLLTHKAIEIENKPYPISHSWHKTPIHLVGCKVDLDRRMVKVAGAARSSPHSLVQELLNRSDDYLWAFLSNGIRLRILRDNLSLTRQAYVEFDLETMMEGEIYSDFVLLWLLCHQSRVEADKPEEFWLEKWSRTAQEQGTRALDQLRNGVEDAIKALGSGFLKHPLNWALREKLKAGQLDKQDYYRQILRLIYRFLFLFVSEDRDMLFDPNSKTEAREFYIEHYSTTRLRRMAEKHRGSRHTDLYQGFRLVSEKLGDHGCPELGLPALGSFLFSKNKALPDLETSEISNEDFLGAIRALAYTLDQGTLRAVDYKNLGSEEFGSVYESLLELHPDINIDAGTFELKAVSGHERKTTGSYYTPSSLVQCLLDSALNPVLDEALKKPDPEKAILDLKICDPASGSGHFLIAAAHRVARRLAAIRTGDEEPAPEAYQSALRDVIGHCIYGVDINPLTVELCKVSLWMEALEPGKPLSFLDHRIRCGNSLMGSTPRLIKQEIPDEAFNPVVGDDKEFTNSLKRQNREERRGQMSLYARMVAEPHITYGDLTKSMHKISNIEDESIQAVREKETHYRKFRASQQYKKQVRVDDAWIAAFVWEKNKNAPLPITQDLFRSVIEDFGSVPFNVQNEIKRIAQQYQFFHWQDEFPEVFRVPGEEDERENNFNGWSGGFDLILGNPPWERIKFQQKEWFLTKRPDIAKAPNAAKRQRMIHKLKEENPSLYLEYIQSRRKAECESHFMRNSGRYLLCGRGDINTFAVFAELNRSLIKPSGLVGCIVPSGIATDDTTKYFFKDLMEKKSLKSLYDFENRMGIFPDVHRSYKFCLLTMTGSAHPITEGSKFVFFLTKINELNDKERYTVLMADDISQLNPNTQTCPTFRYHYDAELTKSIYKRIPVLIKDSPQEMNRWGICFLRMFDMANDSKLFKTRVELEREGWTLDGNIFHEDDKKYLPLYEGKMVAAYNHRFASVTVNPESPLRQSLPIKHSAKELEDINFCNLPLYWVSEQNVREVLKEKYKQTFLVYKRVTTASSERTLKVCLIPLSAVGDKLPILLGPEGFEALCFLANCNSIVLDFVTRQKTGYVNLAQFVIAQLPFLTPEDYEKPCPWRNDILLKRWISERAFQLTDTSINISDIASEISYKGPPFKWDEEQRLLLQSEIDAAYFHLYGIERDDVEYIMNSFSIIKQKENKKYGEFRSMILVLRFYDAMKHSIISSQIYDSHFDLNP